MTLRPASLFAAALLACACSGQPADAAASRRRALEAATDRCGHVDVPAPEALSGRPISAISLLGRP